MRNNVRTTHGPDGEYARVTSPDDYHVYHDPEGSARLSTTLIHALADVMGADVTDSGFALSDSVDPDALDRIFADTADGGGQPHGHVAFTVGGCRVTVYNSGHIVITPPAGPSR